MIREMIHSAINQAQAGDAFRERWENLLENAYQHVEQEIPERTPNSGGYIRAEILDTNGPKQREHALQRIPEWIMELEEAGYGAGDIAVLVRTNDEGAEVARVLMETDQEDYRPGYNFNFISNESLFLHANIAVKFILCLLKYLHNDQDDLNNLTLRYYHRLLTAGEEDAADALAPGITVQEELGETFIRKIPEMNRLIQRLDNIDNVSTGVISFD